MGRRLLQTPEASAYLRAAGGISMPACPGNSVFVFAFGLVFPYSLLFRMVSDCLFSYHRVYRKHR